MNFLKKLVFKLINSIRRPETTSSANIIADSEEHINADSLEPNLVDPENAGAEAANEVQSNTSDQTEAANDAEVNASIYPVIEEAAGGIVMDADVTQETDQSQIADSQPADSQTSSEENRVTGTKRRRRHQNNWSRVKKHKKD